ncbi:MAG TPA: hypothetical protein VHW24_03625, partial [Bryobacteraceae bacterium]|nr:hypothetical protein [Bryobacteraceae bacterium]
ALLACLVVAGLFARAVWPHGNEVWREYSYLGSMDAIALGCLTAIALSSSRMTGRTSRFLAIAGSVLLAICLGCTLLLNRLGVERLGLDMTFVAIATCMIIAASAATEWRGPRVLGPALLLGRRSYEVYLTHMFVVFALFEVFLRWGKPLAGVPALFLLVFVIAAAFGEAVARAYSEPMNRLLRYRAGRPGNLGSVVG